MNSSDDVIVGLVEIGQGKSGYVRNPQRNYAVSPQDPQIQQQLIQKYNLRGGEMVSVTAKRGKKNRGQPIVTEIVSIFNKSPEDYCSVTPFEELEVIHPTEAIRFETPDGPPTTRIVDLFTPIGKGQRGLIVAPPRTGKTILLRQLAEGVLANHPEMHVMMLLVDERPEEVTEMRRLLCKDKSGWHIGAPEVAYSNNDHDAKSHGRLARLMISKAKRYLELGKDVFILLDSLTRLGRAFNTIVGSSGRTMTGGLDIRALEIPKQMFGSARKIEHGGSLTILASVLVETGSRMDDFIFQEFKGTGNMELVLSRDLANLRIWPAMNLAASGTRKEELLLGAEACDKVARLRRRLISMSPTRQMETLLGELSKQPSNNQFLAAMAT